jgi:hypothetical protein
VAKQAGAWNLRTSRSVTPDLEVLKLPTNAHDVVSIVLDASAVTPDGNGNRKLVAGTPLTKVGNQYRRYTDAATQDCLGILVETIEFPDGTAKSDAVTGMWSHGQWFRADRIVDWAMLGASIRADLPTCKFG